MHPILKKPKHPVTILILAAVITVIGLLRFQFDSHLQFLILSVLVLFYLGWAIAYHHFDKSLRLEIILEYVLTAALALIFFYGLLL